MFRFDDKVCAVTGAATGIGFEMARLFSKSGAKCVFLLDIDESSAKEAAKKIPGRAIALKCDVTNAESVRDCFDKMMRMVDRIDVLCNNAGIGHVGSIKGRFHIVFVLLSFLFASPKFRTTDYRRDGIRSGSCGQSKHQRCVQLRKGSNKSDDIGWKGWCYFEYWFLCICTSD